MLVLDLNAVFFCRCMEVFAEHGKMQKAFCLVQFAAALSSRRRYQVIAIPE